MFDRLVPAPAVPAVVQLAVAWRRGFSSYIRRLRRLVGGEPAEAGGGIESPFDVSVLR